MKTIIGFLIISIHPFLVVAQPVNLEESSQPFLLISNKELWVSSLAIALGIIAIGMQVYQSWKNSKSRKSSKSLTTIIDLQRDLDWVKSELNWKLVPGDLNQLAERLKRIEDKIDKAELPFRQIEWTDLNRQAKGQKSDLIPDTQDPEPDLFFAKFADLEDGFSSGIISSVQNGEQVYEIQTTGDKAVYCISSDPNAQKYALAESTYTLGKACELINQPFKGCQIIMQKEGTLAKISGNWIIEQKATIEFK